VPRIPDDRFRIFVSHKHVDADLARTVQDEIEALSPLFECWVSGDDISSGTDWNNAITVALGRSHLLLLLFTTPARTWDWCLYEAGLFTQFANADHDDVRSVVCIVDPAGGPPRPLASIQGVPAATKNLTKMLRQLCVEPWEMCDDWRRGPVVPDIDASKLNRAAKRISTAFRKAIDADSPEALETYHPCHRLVLDIGAFDDAASGIPEDASIVTGPGATTGFTLSLFGIAEGDAPHTWGQILDRLGGRETAWRKELDVAIDAARRRELFIPGDATFSAWDEPTQRSRVYHPVLYSVTRRPVNGTPYGQAVILLDPLPQ
jgi:hypothetical protein